MKDIKNFITTDASIRAALGASKCTMSHEPDTPDEHIAIYPYGGRSPEKNSRFKYHSNVQIRVRGGSAATAYNACQKVIDRMHYNASCVASTNGYAYALNSQPIFLFRDDDRRTYYVCNFEVRYVKY
jgi:hypothetical protein